MLNSINRYKLLAGILMTASVIVIGLKVGESKAQASSGFSGKCGMIFGRDFVGSEVPRLGLNNVLINSLVLINFDNNTAEVTTSSVSNFGNSGATTTQSTDNNVAFTRSAGPITGSIKLRFGADDFVLNVLPVNSGNTYLIQIDSDNAAPGSGVCQKV